MTYQIPPEPNSYVPPPVPVTPERKAVVLRIGSVFGIVYVLGSLIYLLQGGLTMWQAVVNIIPLGAIWALTIIGLSRGMDTLTRWLGYAGAVVTLAAFVLAYATGK
jgi:hypothetical protein